MAIKSLDKSLNAVFLACLDYYRTNSDSSGEKQEGQLNKTLRKVLSKVLLAMAQLHAPNYSGWQVDESHPGYLMRLEGRMFVRVPYHVLPTFPSGPSLEAIWHLSRTLRSSNNSVICVSGSNVLRAVFDIVGDVDFLEYLKCGGADIGARFTRNIDSEKDVWCLKIVAGPERWEIPWRDGKPTGDYLNGVLDPSSPELSTMKFDYAGDVSTIGVVDISNLVVATDSAGKSAGLHRTFAAQEASFVPVDHLPNQMNDPIEMGRYIDWLDSAIEEYRGEGDFGKCLKRCASLSRVLFLSSITDQIVEIASQTPLFLANRVRALTELDQKLSLAGTDSYMVLQAPLRTQIKTLKAELKRRRGQARGLSEVSFRDATNEIAEQLRTVLDGGLSQWSKT